MRARRKPRPTRITGAPPPPEGVRSPTDARLSGDDRSVAARRAAHPERARVHGERARLLAFVLRSLRPRAVAEPLDRADRAPPARAAVGLGDRSLHRPGGAAPRPERRPPRGAL